MGQTLQQNDPLPKNPAVIMAGELEPGSYRARPGSVVNVAARPVPEVREVSPDRVVNN